ncbi:hypothetical protein U1Q18_019684 [Sarracenia purpurea var. burkii]
MDLRCKQWAEKKLPTDAPSTGTVSGGEHEVREREQRRRSSSPPSPAFFFARVELQRNIRLIDLELEVPTEKNSA